MTFERVVADWLRSQGVAVREVTKVASYGTDWAGDTEGGFYDRFEVTVHYVNGDGDRVQRDVVGEALQDLWQYVTTAWPANA